MIMIELEEVSFRYSLDTVTNYHYWLWKLCEINDKHDQYEYTTTIIIIIIIVRLALQITLTLSAWIASDFKTSSQQ